MAALPAALAEAPTVLLVEDDHAFLDLLQDSLESHGLRVLAESSPEAAIDRATTHPGPIDLLVTDVMLPGMSGGDLADRIGARRQGLRLLFMSGYSDTALRERGALPERAVFLRKPFSLAQLDEVVRGLLEPAP